MAKTTVVPCEFCGETKEYEEGDPNFPPDIYRVASPEGRRNRKVPPLERAARLGYRFGRVCGRCRKDHPERARELGLKDPDA